MILSDGAQESFTYAQKNRLLLLLMRYMLFLKAVVFFFKPDLITSAVK